MAKKTKSKLKGVYSQEYKTVKYWYAWIYGSAHSFGRGEKGRKAAEAAKHKELGRKHEQKQVNGRLDVKRSKLKTINELIDWYMKQRKVKKLKSYNQRKSSIKHLKEYFGKFRVHALDAGDQEMYRDFRTDQGAMDGTIDHEIAILSSMYHMAVKRSVITAESMPREFVLEKIQIPRRRITEDEYQALLKHADPDFRDILICGWESAMRSGEIINLTRSQVHLDAPHYSREKLDYIDLGIFDTKNGARRTVPVSAELKAVLKRRVEGLGADDLVFTNERGKLYTELVAQNMRATCDKAGVPYGDKNVNSKGERIGTVFHCLRHTRASMWVEQGFSD